jgi:hypothetical protein
MDEVGNVAIVKNDISFSDIDSIYFTNVGAGVPFNMLVETSKGEVNIMAKNAPNYETGDKKWISLDYSLQSSIALKQWMQWQNNKDKHR